jgi:hypothetical protein
VTLSVAIHELDDLVTPVAELDDTFDRSVTMKVNDAGSGSFSMHLDDPQLAAIDFGRIAMFTHSDSGQRIGVRIEHQQRGVLRENGEFEQTAVISGRGLAALLEGARTYPEGGVDQPQPYHTRLYSFANPAFVPVGWVNAVLTTNPYVPEGWPDPAIGPYIFGENATVSAAPAGPTWLLRTFTVGAEVEATVFASADNWGPLYLDGVPIMEMGAYQSSGYRRTFETDVLLGVGDHVLGARVFNKGSDNHGGLRLAMVESDDPSTVIVQSDTSWLSLEGGSPGMNPGEVLVSWLTEAQARGALPGWTRTFDGDLDSAGNPWAAQREIPIPVGDEGLTVCRSMSSAYIDWRVELDDLVLHAYVKGGMGAASGVSFVAADSITDLGAEGEG